MEQTALAVTELCGCMGAGVWKEEASFIYRAWETNGTFLDFKMSQMLNRVHSCNRAYWVSANDYLRHSSDVSHWYKKKHQIETIQKYTRKGTRHEKEYNNLRIQILSWPSQALIAFCYEQFLLITDSVYIWHKNTIKLIFVFHIKNNFNRKFGFSRENQIIIG